MKRILAFSLAAGILCLACPEAAPAREVLIKLGTIAPEGSVWYRMLQRIGQEWGKITGGEVKVRIYPGGVLGDEPDLVRKVNIGQLQAVGLSGGGMYVVDQSVMALQIPLMIQSYEELDFMMARLAPKLEQIYARRGFIVLNWTDGGWVHFFTKRPVYTPDDLRKVKLFQWAGDRETMELFKAGGFQPVPLQATDMVSALQTGLIEAFDVPPLVALVNQWFGLAGNMLDLKWAPLVGATMVSKRVWSKIPEAHREDMRKAAQGAALELQGKIREMSMEAVVEMEKRGLKVIPLNDAQRELWVAEVKKVHGDMRGKMVPVDLFDEVLRLHKEYLAGRKGKP